ncbi:MAG: hypothetical protein ACRDTT_25825 [Pseudonocardiaceae bacterium]
MWVLLSSKLRNWLLIAVGIPVLAWVLERVGNELETRQGRQTRVSRNLQRASGWLHRKERGPFARRDRSSEPAHGRLNVSSNRS